MVVCVTGGSSYRLLSLTANSHMQQVCVGQSNAASVICYSSVGKQTSLLSTAGVGTFGVTYSVLSGL